MDRYFAILEGKERARYLENKGRIKNLAERAWEIYEECHFCEHRCGVNRNERTGICNVGRASIATHFMHYGEERVLVPSYTIFFSGCNFKCVYCQNWDISQGMKGIYIEPERMAYIINGLEGRARNINWVGGEPTPNLPHIVDVLSHSNSNIPQVWNSNMYCSEETMGILKYIMDVYLTDFKYGNNTCAERLSKVKDYWEITTRNHEIAGKQGEMIIRHLLLPNHLECCTLPILQWIADNVPHAVVNIMDQYYPTYKAFEYSDINRRITAEEYRVAYKHAEKLGLNLV